MEFDRDLIIHNFTNITSEVLKIEIVPNINTNNVSRLDFDFICVKFNNTNVEIQLLFKEPNYISASGQDYLTI